jgi:hypothetical protein
MRLAQSELIYKASETIRSRNLENELVDPSLWYSETGTTRHGQSFSFTNNACQYIVRFQTWV